MKHRFGSRGLLPWAVPLLGALILVMAPGGDPVAPDSRQGWPDRVRIGYSPQTHKETCQEAYQALGDYLSAQLDLLVVMVPFDDYPSVIREFKASKLEAGYLGSSSYVEAADAKVVDPVAAELDTQGRAGYRSVMIVGKESKIQKREDIKGKVLAFSDRSSTSSYIVPCYCFKDELKTSPEEMAAKVVFTKSHAKVIKGVHDGEYDVGTTNNRDLEREIASGKYQDDEFRVIWMSPLIPAGPFAARKDLPQSFKDAFARALVNIDDQKLKNKMGIGGYAPVNDSEYDIIRKIKKFTKEL